MLVGLKVTDSVPALPSYSTAEIRSLSSRACSPGDEALRECIEVSQHGPGFFRRDDLLLQRRNTGIQFWEAFARPSPGGRGGLQPGRSYPP